jgi:hypothetical protein
VVVRCSSSLKSIEFFGGVEFWWGGGLGVSKNELVALTA